MVQTAKPVVLLAHGPNPALAQRLGELIEFKAASDGSAETVVREGQGAIAIMAGEGVRYGAEVFDGIPSLQFVCVAGSGGDSFDEAAATERGIPILNNAGQGHIAVAEYVIAVMLTLLKRLKQADAGLRSGALSSRDGWRGRIMPYLGRDAQGKTLGVVGMGHIGVEAARKARLAFGMRVLAYDPYAASDRFEGVTRADKLDDLLRESDVVTLHVPLLNTTHHLIGEAQLGMMKRDAILINAARGPVLDEEALFRVMSGGHLAGAALDTFDSEPPRGDHPLFGLSNVFVTPHIAGVTQEALAKLQEGTVQNLLAAIRGERPPQIANPTAWPPRRRVAGQV